MRRLPSQFSGPFDESEALSRTYPWTLCVADQARWRDVDQSLHPQRQVLRRRAGRVVVRPAAPRRRRQTPGRRLHALPHPHAVRPAALLPRQPAVDRLPERRGARPLRRARARGQKRLPVARQGACAPGRPRVGRAAGGAGARAARHRDRQTAGERRDGGAGRRRARRRRARAVRADGARGAPPAPPDPAGGGPRRRRRGGARPARRAAQGARRRRAGRRGHPDGAAAQRRDRRRGQEDRLPPTAARRVSALGSTDALLAYDREHVWHPYAPLPAALPPLPVESAAGVRLRLADGRELIDGMASWWCAIHGYRVPALDAAVRDQLDRMAHVMFGGLTHAPAVELARRLVELTPDGLEHVFFADSGSVSVEVAIKMALQFQRARGRPERQRLLALRGGYHGDTFGAMSACDPVGGMHELWTGTLPRQLFAPCPPAGFGAAEVDPAWDVETTALFEAHAGELAAAIAEPVVQGAGGMHVYAPAYVRRLRELCDAHDVLLILDEIATGFGRTGGELFAAAHAGVAPDVMCVGKALTGGYMTLAATLCSAWVARGIGAGEAGVLMHGPTFMANPLACAVALASLGLLEERDWRADVARVEAGLRAGLAPAAAQPGVADVRVQGAIGVVQLDRPVDVAAATAAAVEHGVWLRPFRDLVYAMPPYAIGDEDLAAVAAAMCAAAKAA
ncbi:MAG: adenosylmethionine--8-amino-7-oxononanoate transaminase [Actinobacteria bacterium]|nr:adenosylmethionine--8-amino-7-oxononanoate transaminase [Actinomycetota bacterium]